MRKHNLNVKKAKWECERARSEQNRMFTARFGQINCTPSTYGYTVEIGDHHHVTRQKGPRLHAQTMRAQSIKCKSVCNYIIRFPIINWTHTNTNTHWLNCFSLWKYWSFSSAHARARALATVPKQIDKLRPRLDVVAQSSPVTKKIWRWLRWLVTELVVCL